MKWFRLHTEARTDRKLDTLSDAEFRVWFNLLCLAAEQPERGTIEFEDVEILALEVAKGDVELLGHALSRLSRLRSVTYEDGRVSFPNWNKRQYDKPSDWPEQTRVRKAKERESKAKTSDDAGHGVTGRDVTPQIQIQNRTDTEDKREKEGADAPNPSPPVTRIDAAWEPDETDWDYAVSKGMPEDDIPSEAETFRDWYLQQGERGLRADWPATWRSWVQREMKRRDNAPIPLRRNGRQMISVSDQIDEWAEELKRGKK